MLRRVAKNNNGKALKVDSGNLLFKRSGGYRDDSPEAIQAAAIGEVYTRLGYDAVAVGADDLSAGVGFLLNMRDEGLNLVSANIYDDEGNHIFAPYQERVIGRLKIGILGITGPRSQDTLQYRISDPGEALKQLIPTLEKEFDLIVLLSPLPVHATTALVEQFPAIRVGISADKTKGNFGPQKVGDGLIVQTANRGQYLGALSISYQNGGPWRPDPSRLKNSNDHQQKPYSGDGQFSSYRGDFLPLVQTGRGDAQIDYIVDQAKRRIKNPAAAK